MNLRTIHNLAAEALDAADTAQGPFVKAHVLAVESGDKDLEKRLDAALAGLRQTQDAAVELVELCEEKLVEQSRAAAHAALDELQDGQMGAVIGILKSLKK